MSHTFFRTAQGEKNAAYLVPETLKAVRPSLCSVRGKRHSLFKETVKLKASRHSFFKKSKEVCNILFFIDLWFSGEITWAAVGEVVDAKSV